MSLSDTSLASDFAISMLSVAALATKNIVTLFVPGQAINFDMDDSCKVLGQAIQYFKG